MYKLREIERKDISEINKWRNDKELIKFLGAPYRFINEEVDIGWYENYMNNRNNTIRCAITLQNDEKIIGLITLNNIDYINRVAVLHIMIDRTYQNKGAGSFAIKNILEYVFEDLNLNRIELEVLSDNARAIAVYKKNGFREEGLRREACYKEGKYINQISMAILKKEYLLLRHKEI